MSFFESSVFLLLLLVSKAMPKRQGFLNMRWVAFLFIGSGFSTAEVHRMRSPTVGVIFYCYRGQSGRLLEAGC